MQKFFNHLYPFINARFRSFYSGSMVQNVVPMLYPKNKNPRKLFTCKGFRFKAAVWTGLILLHLFASHYTDYADSHWLMTLYFCIQKYPSANKSDICCTNVVPILNSQIKLITWQA